MALAYLGFAVLDGKDANATPLTGTITVPTGTTYAVGMVQAGDDLGQPDVTSVLIDGDAFSPIGTQSDAALAGLPTTMQMFDLENPTVGSGLTGTVNYNLPPFASVCVFAFFSGQDTTTPTEGFQLSTGTGTAVAGDVSTTTANGDIVLAHVLANVAGIANISTSDTQITEVNTSDAVNVASSFAYQAVTGSGAEVNWTLGSSVDYRTQAIVIKAAATGVTGTSATTNANDTSSASGTTTIVGASARTNAADTSAASGTTTVLGTSSTTNAVDVSTASGSIGEPVSGTSETTNADDVSSASGTTTILGVSATTEGADVSAISGTTTVLGTSATTNAIDTSSVTATTTVLGSSATTNADDTSDASGVVGGGSIGESATTNAPDVGDASGNTGIVCSADITNNLDTCNAIGDAGTPEVITPTFGGGLSSSRAKRYYIERDGKRIFFTDERQVYDLLHQEEKRVVKKAKKAIKRVTKAEVAELISFKDLDIPKPKIVMHFNDAAINKNIAQINARIHDNYVKALMRHIEDMEEDEIFLELLFH